MDQIWPLSCTPTEGRQVIQALDSATSNEMRLAIVEQFRGHVVEACLSPSANFVMQRAVEVLDPSRLQFMLSEMKGAAMVLTASRYGSRVVQRLIEFCPMHQKEGLIDE